MKLDSRIKSLSDILTCFDIESAEQFIGQKGYFEDYLDKYNSLEVSECGTLTEVVDNEVPFKSDDRCHWRFFIPESKLLKDKKKEFRPFSIIEFKGNLPKMIFTDDLIHFRHKNNGFSEYAQRYNGYIIDGKTAFICLGSRDYYSLENLFKNFEYLDKNGEWNMFGVEE